MHRVSPSLPLLVAFLTTFSVDASAFQTNGAVWDVQSGAITYNLEPNGSDDINDGSDLDAVRFAFERWACADQTSLRFREGIAPGVKSNSLGDGLNSVFWDESDEFGLGPATLGINVGNVGNPDNPVTRNASIIIFNGVDYTWSTDDNISNTDVESIAVHEIGHWIGLGHSCTDSSETDCRPDAVMNPTYPGGNFRQLQEDDLDGLRSLYPSVDDSTCTGPFRQGEFCACDDECIGDLICHPDASGQNVCSPGCSSDAADCPSTFACQLSPPEAEDEDAPGVCIKSVGGGFPAGTVCTNDGACAEGLCIAVTSVARSICRVTCEDDAGCGDGEICSEGTCLLDPTTIGLDCPGGCGCKVGQTASPSLFFSIFILASGLHFRRRFVLLTKRAS